MATLAEFEERARASDRIDWSTRGTRAVSLMGALGEFGSVLSEVKKKRRDGEPYTGFRDRFVEELGDLLWYVAAIARYCGVRLADVEQECVLNTDEGWFELGNVLSQLACEVDGDRQRQETARALLARAIGQVRKGAGEAGVTLEHVAEVNLAKVTSRWQSEPETAAPNRDQELDLPPEERLPRQVTIDFIERKRGSRGASVILQCRGISVGDRLTDNAHEDDGYRFHDAFHLAHAAVLGWSPVIRALFRCKRKSQQRLDEVEDGARAVIAEESVSFLTFDYARNNSLLKGVSRVDQDLIRHIQSVVSGLEVATRDRWEWEHAILQGYGVFRQLNSKPQGGQVRIDADHRLIEYLGPIEPA